ncbi:MAG TPA: ATP-binding cassette domain-containing protein [Blastocatellia bacterium]|jgi:sodium transport system ATP-binding protein|nr:ATP-binding cassette domain-containing protein [Blastocatellia bacterium]
MINVKDLTKVYRDKKRGKIVAVDHISFEANKGEIFGVLGPNGAGKTTTLRMLATILQSTEGTATIGGHDVNKEPQQVRRKIGFLSGDMGLYHRLTPRELLRFFGRLNGIDGSELERRIDSLFELFDMRHFADSKIDALSTGMRQKTAISRTILHDPPILILDEPTSGLDVPTAHVVERYIRDARAAGKCIVFSTHVMEEAEHLCDRIAVINRGRIRAVGTMDDLRSLTGKNRLREIFIDLLGINETTTNRG